MLNERKFTIAGNIVDINQQEIYEGGIRVEDGIIKALEVKGELNRNIHRYILPGFIDSHVHIESSMIVPSEFARIATIHGTVATVSDPHEIANVCGIKGVEFMIENGKRVPFKFHFGAPSCVPATTFETSGASIDSNAIKTLLEKKEVKYLSEMMNFPGVLSDDPGVMKKIHIAQALNKPIDGHAPGLRGEKAKHYIDAGITTDHECFTKEEALEKLQYGMKILIREGSAAKNFEALIDLLNDYPDMMMFCSDDKHPDSLVEGHINVLCARAVAKGIDLFKILKAACINPVLHYKLDVGVLQKGDAADFIVVEDLQDFKVSETYVDGKLVAKNGSALIRSIKFDLINHFHCSSIGVKDLKVEYANEEQLPVIEAMDGQLITNKFSSKPKVKDGKIASDVANDVLKIAVVNRYKDAPVAKSFIKGFGLKEGAIASSVAHDSHNIVAVGVDDESMMRAINLIIKEKGGISCVHGRKEMILPLPVAGLMSDKDGFKVAALYTAIDHMAKEMGSVLSAPFMTLSFMALLVIPHLKLSDLGLFDGDTFSFVG